MPSCVQPDSSAQLRGPQCARHLRRASKRLCCECSRAIRSASQDAKHALVQARSPLRRAKVEEPSRLAFPAPDCSLMPVCMQRGRLLGPSCLPLCEQKSIFPPKRPRGKRQRQMSAQLSARSAGSPQSLSCSTRLSLHACGHLLHAHDPCTAVQGLRPAKAQ